MNLTENIADFFSFKPYFGLIENKKALFKFFIFSQPSLNLKLRKRITLKVNRKEIDAFKHLLAVLKYSADFFYNNNELEVSFDKKNKFTLSLSLSSNENLNLLKLFHYGIQYGVHFKSDSTLDIVNYHKTLRILKSNDKKIIQTHDGIKFYLDSIDPWIILETFILGIHKIDHFKSMEGKVVLDVGANVGDTPLYYASQRAKVYAFEPVEEHFQAMLRNIKLNPQLSDKIFPIKAAIGLDGPVKIHHSKLEAISYGASIYYNTHKNDSVVDEVKGYSLNSALVEFGIEKVDLLKMDCKGCEFFLDDDSLKRVDTVKIEYSSFNSNKIEDLIRILQRNQFKIITYLHNPEYRETLSHHGTLLAVKKESID